MKILIVDDKVENTYLLESLLKGNGYETISAKNGAEALELAKKEQPQLIISDILMPVMDGFTFCLECKKNSSLESVPFIFYTATYTSIKDEEFALSLGADKFILKPQEPDVFIEIIEQVLKEVGEDNIKPHSLPSLPEEVVLKEYNSTLIRKLEDKMAQAEESANELRITNAELQKEIEEHKRSEESLRNSEEKFRITFEDAPVGMCLTALEGRIIIVNNALASMLGYSKEELVNKSFVDFTLEDDVETSLKFRQKMISGEMQMHRYEKRFLHKNGNQIFADVNIALIKDAKNNPIYFVTHIINITDRIKAEDALRLSERKYRSLITQSPDGIFVVDLEGNFMSVNKSMCDELKFSEKEFLSMKIWDVVPYQYMDQFKKRMAKIIKHEDIYEAMEYEVKGKDNKLHHVEVLSAPYYKDNELIGFQGIARDITERKISERKIALLAHAIESVSECISITDENNNIIFVNDAFLKTYGYSEEELIGKNIKIVRNDDEKSVELLEKILPGTVSGGWKGEIINRKKDGTAFPVYLSTSVIKDSNNTPIALIGVANDITETKKVREELINAKEQAEKSDQLKTEFLTQMSHEIRTPMNVIANFAKVIKDEIENGRYDELSSLLDGIELSTERIIRTIELILNMSEVQIGAYKPIWKNIDLVKEILLDLQTEYTYAARKKGLDINFIYKKKCALINGDHYSINQIFNNLLDNAIKYTEKGKIDVILAEDSSAKTQVTILDSGIGISAEFLVNLFEPFMQEERGYSRSYEGNGLGLALVKKYCDLNHVNISFESEKGKGSKVILTFN